MKIASFVALIILISRPPIAQATILCLITLGIICPETRGPATDPAQPAPTPVEQTPTTIAPTPVSTNAVMDFLYFRLYENLIMGSKEYGDMGVAAQSGIILYCYDGDRYDLATNGDPSPTQQYFFTLPAGCTDQPVEVTAYVCANFKAAVSVWRVTEDRASMVCVERSWPDGVESDCYAGGSRGSSTVTWDAYPDAGTYNARLWLLRTPDWSTQNIAITTRFLHMQSTLSLCTGTMALEGTSTSRWIYLRPQSCLLCRRLKI